MTTSKRTRVLSVEFSQPPFRKLSNLAIPISERLTLIAGHNGIGKTTILGLLANTFGFTDGPRSYFGDHYFANIEKIVYLAVNEVDKAQSHATSPPVVVADVNGVIVKKRCAMTKRGKENRARVVPRTIEKAENDPVGQDAKIPLPTIYLGIRRLASIGEADDREVATKLLQMHEDDRKILVDFVRLVISGAQVTAEVTHQSIKGSKKRSAQPGYENHDSLAISMGQDSLGSIGTALASFNMLQRELGKDYQGGLLVIDELDVGFHPHAIEKLARYLKQYAGRLKLQVVATTHSPRLIAAVHPDDGGHKKAPDSVVYLLDTLNPRIAEDQSLQAILDDMALRQDLPTTAKRPVLGVYFEDEEGKEFFDALVPAGKKRSIGAKNGIRIKSIALGVGGSNLIQLPDHDPVFKNRVLVVDADTTVTQKAAKRGNTVKLPCTKGAIGTNRSPENVVIGFIQSMISATGGSMRDALLALNTTNSSSDKVREAFFPDASGAPSGREATKRWWNQHRTKLKNWRVLETWAEYNQVQALAFIQAFETAVSKTAPRLR